MSRKKLSTTIYVTPEQNDALKLLHARTKVPIAVYIREGIDMVLHSYAHLLPGQLALAALDAQAEAKAKAGAPPSSEQAQQALAVQGGGQGAGAAGGNHSGQHAATGGGKK